jgi:uncharacterized membrane protein YhaH (DUF805 family)
MVQAANPYDAPKSAVQPDAGETRPVRVFSISGRIGRVRYIAYGIGFYFLIGILGAIVGFALDESVGIVLMWVGLLVIGFMLTIQRCHDFNTSGWLSLLVLLPLINLVFWFIPGTDGPNRYGPPTPPNGVGAIILVCVVPVLLVVGGILAAVAIPAYQDYTHRAKVSEAIVSASAWREAVGEHHARTGKLPASVGELSKEAVPAEEGRYGKVSLGRQGVLTLTLSSASGSLADKTIVLQPKIAGGALSWDCGGGTLEQKYRPGLCRRQ